MKKALLLLAALSAISFAAAGDNIFNSKNEPTAGKIDAYSKVFVNEENLTFKIEVEGDSNVTVENNNSKVTFDHGTIQNGLTLGEQGESYTAKPTATITITEITNSPKFSGEIKYGFTENADNNSGSVKSNPSSFGIEPNETNLQAKYTLSTTDNKIHAGTEEDRKVKFTLISELSVNDSIEGANNKVYVPVGDNITPNTTNVYFKYVKDSSINNY